MENIKIRKFGIATGLTGAIVYIGCILIMNILGGDALVKIANLLFHGIDFSSIIRMNISIGESLLGIVISFIFWGAIGVSIASIYNKTKTI